MIDIFKKKYAELFCEEGYCINYVSNIMYSLGYHENLTSKLVRKDVLEVIEQLFKYNIIYVVDWGDEKIKEKEISVDDAMQYIIKLWPENYNEELLYTLPEFFYKDSYITKIKELKVNKNTKWEWFCKKTIPKIKIWAKEQEGKNFNVNEQ